MASEIVNIAGYRFVDLPDRDELREPFKTTCDEVGLLGTCLLYTSPSPRDKRQSRMPSSA